MILFLAGTMQAQVSVNVSIGSPPQWGPLGYTDVRYYYLPDVEAYYDVQSSMFIYSSSGRWVHRSNLPLRYRSYDLYQGYKVVLSDYSGNAPYSQFKEHKIKYARGYRGPEQKTIGDRPGKNNSKTPMVTDRSNHKESQIREQNKVRGNNKTVINAKGRGGGNGKKK